jgi:CRP-like cAMP-binding protein
MRDVPLLARLADDDLAALAARGKERNFPPNTVLFREGDPGESFHVVMTGRLRGSVMSAEGTEVTIALFERGDCCGEIALLDGGPRTVTTTAVQATRTFAVTRDDFLEWVRERPAAAIALLETLAGRLRRTDQALADLSFLDLEHRLAKQLLVLSAGGASPRIEVTQAGLASMLSVSRESVNKQLNDFQRQGWITLGRGTVTVKDAAALRV